MDTPAWESFYVIVGSSGGALIGLQFVVITLIVDRRRPTSARGVDAYATPTVVHLTAALVLSAIMSAPWSNALVPSFAVGLTGAAGLVYAAVVADRTRRHRQTGYKPVWEDWVWYSISPALAYLSLGASAFMRADSSRQMFMIGGASLALLLIGIHNAWDTVTHLVISEAAKDAPKRRK